LDTLEKTLSNLIESQFPDIYRSDGPLFVSFVVAYFRWLETSQRIANKKQLRSTVGVIAQNNVLIGTNSSFTNVFANGDQIALYKDVSNYELYTINAVSNNSYLTLTTTPQHSNTLTVYANTKPQYNAIYHARRLFEYRDIDETIADFIVYFKETYLKDIQFETNSNVRQMVKHSLDIYRSKGSERAIDLLFRLVFGTGAEVYYPSSDLFRLSDGDWNVPIYLEVSLSFNNVLLAQKQIVGLRSGATAFVDKVVRRSVAQRLIDVLYISPINGDFMVGEQIDTEDRQFSRIKHHCAVIGSLTSLEVDSLGSGEDFEVGEIVSLRSVRGREGYARVTETTDITGLVDFELINGGYGYTVNSEILISDRVLTLANVNLTNANAFSYFNYFENIKQPLANVVYISANGIGANLSGNVATNSSITNVVGTGTTFTSQYTVGGDIAVYSAAGTYEVREILSITNNTLLTVNAEFSFSNSDTEHAVYNRFEVGDNVYTYYANNLLRGTGIILELTEANVHAGEMFVSELTGDVGPIATFNANLTGNVVVAQDSANVFSEIPGTNVAGNSFVRSFKSNVFGDGTNYDKALTYPEANLAGTISVNTTTANVVGTGTDFTTLAANDYIAAYSNSTNWHARRVASVTNATHLIVDSAFPFTNTAANGAEAHIATHLSAWKNSTVYEIRSINSIANATYLTLTERFTFTNAVANVGNTSLGGTLFIVPNANQTGTIAIVAGNVSVTGTGTNLSSFNAGDYLAAYSNSTAYTLRRIVSVTNATHLTVNRSFGFANGTGATFANMTSNASIIFGSYLAFHTNSTTYEVHRVNNVVNATYLTTQSLFDASNSAVIFGNVSTTNKIYSESNTIIANISSHTDKTASANLMGISANMVLSVISTTGSFSEDEEVYQLDGGGGEIALGNFTSFVSTVGANGILRVSNAEGIFLDGFTVYGRDSGASANVASVSFNIGVINVFNNFTTLDNNWLYGNQMFSNATLTVLSEGDEATFSISNDFLYTEFIDTGSDEINQYLNIDLNATYYGFDGNPLANLTNETIFDALGIVNTEFGRISAITGVNRGNDYTVAPFVLIYEPKSHIYGERDYILGVVDGVEAFQVGEVITQAASGARGYIHSANSSHLIVDRLRVLQQHDFVLTTNSTTTIVGTDSGATANVNFINANNRTRFVGINANVLSDVHASEGAVVELDVLNSGFGFANSETVTFTSASGEKTGTAVAILEKQGEGNGYYRDEGGFLSDTKKLFDGLYYQEFSYDVQSSLTLARYEDMLRRVLHVAGTKYFGTLVYKSQANVNLRVANTIITLS
jgi:hypothetical protein